MSNKMNAIRIEKLHPIVANAARELIQRVESEGIKILITQTLRTIEEQNALYAQGRTKPGQKVTEVRGGYSYHNYGLALDFCLLDGQGNMAWDVNDKWRRVAAIGKELGFAWGGDWKGFVDYPHLEMTFGLTCADLKAGKKPPEAKGAEPKLEKWVASTIYHTWIKPAWEKANASGDQKTKDDMHLLANKLREACGMKEDEDFE